MDNEKAKQIVKIISKGEAFGVGFCSAIILFGLCIDLLDPKSKYENKIKDEYLNKDLECTTIIVNDGVVRRIDGAHKNGHTSDIYDVSYKDDKSLVLYIYDDNFSEDKLNEKELFADYIESNIIIDKKNNVYFNPTTITKEGYIQYRANILDKNEEGIQRKRS